MSNQSLESDCPIKVSVTSEYLAKESKPRSKRYAFAYHVSIANLGEQPSKLISRHWIITDGDDREQVVRGDGVIGEQPTIKPGEVYRYSSGTIMETPVGFMRGSYQMVNHDGSHFDAPIPAFTLANPSELN